MFELHEGGLRQLCIHSFSDIHSKRPVRSLLTPPHISNTVNTIHSSTKDYLLFTIQYITDPHPQRSPPSAGCVQGI